MVTAGSDNINTPVAYQHTCADGATNRLDLSNIFSDEAEQRTCL